MPFALPESLVTMGEVLDDLSAVARTVQYATFETWRERQGRVRSATSDDSGARDAQSHRCVVASARDLP